MARLGTWLPFAPAARLLAHFTGTTVSAATARRQTERAGAAWVQLQTADVERLEHDLPASPAGPAAQVVSVDGAMAPLVGGEWGEVKLLTIGTLHAEPGGAPHARALSYFGRRADHATFARLALTETHRRGVETAEVVVGVTDGAEWCQEFLAYHRPDAVRILDFAHAASYLHAAAAATFGAESAAAQTWVAQQAHQLKHGDPATVLRALAALPADQAPDPGAARAAQATSFAYLDKRRAQLRYAVFQAAGYPIGSGAAESANKLVTEARLKGAGMRWAPAAIDPMVALRTVECADRWTEVWPQIGPALRAATRRSPAPVVMELPPAPPPLAPAAFPPAAPAHPPTIVAGRPTRQHPWKRLPCLPGGRAARDRHPEL